MKYLAAVLTIGALVVVSLPAAADDATPPSAEPDLGLALLKQVEMTAAQEQRIAALRVELFQDLARLRGAKDQRAAAPVSPLVQWREQQRVARAEADARRATTARVQERQDEYRRTVLELLTPQQRLRLARLIRGDAHSESGGTGTGSASGPTAHADLVVNSRDDFTQDRSAHRFGHTTRSLGTGDFWSDFPLGIMELQRLPVTGGHNSHSRRSLPDGCQF